MKDKTHSMNMEAGGTGAVNGYEKIPNSEMKSRRDRKDRQMKWANLEDNMGLEQYEGMKGADEDYYGGFLPRNNYEDRS